MTENTAEDTIIKLFGAIIIVDGVASIAFSKDQRPISNIGRLIRTGIGVGLLKFG